MVESWTHIVLERAVQAWIARSILHGPPAAYIWDPQHGLKMISLSILELWMVCMATLLELSTSTPLAQLYNDSHRLRETCVGAMP